MLNQSYNVGSVQGLICFSRENTKVLKDYHLRRLNYFRSRVIQNPHKKNEFSEELNQKLKILEKKIISEFTLKYEQPPIRQKYALSFQKPSTVQINKRSSRENLDVSEHQHRSRESTAQRESRKPLEPIGCQIPDLEKNNSQKVLWKLSTSKIKKQSKCSYQKKSFIEPLPCQEEANMIHIQSHNKAIELRQQLQRFRNTFHRSSQSYELGNAARIKNKSFDLIIDTNLKDKSEVEKNERISLRIPQSQPYHYPRSSQNQKRQFKIPTKRFIYQTDKIEPWIVPNVSQFSEQELYIQAMDF